MKIRLVSSILVGVLSIIPAITVAAINSPEQLRDELFAAWESNDPAAAESLLCIEGASPRFRDMYVSNLTSVLDKKIVTNEIELDSGKAAAEVKYLVAPEGLLRLGFDPVDRYGEPNYQVETYFYFGKVKGSYCFLVPIG